MGVEETSSFYPERSRKHVDSLVLPALVEYIAQSEMSQNRSRIQYSRYSKKHGGQCERASVRLKKNSGSHTRQDWRALLLSTHGELCSNAPN